MARNLEQLDGARLYQIDARDIQGGALSRQYLPVPVRADNRADAIARLIASDFEPILDAGDLGIEPEFCANSYPDMTAAIAREIPAP